MPHGFSTRAGLTPENILPGAALVRVRQVHSAVVETVATPRPWLDATPPEADGMVTNRAGVLLAIVTADCAPVLLADRGAGTIGAAHAGWRGALGGVLGNVVEAMVALGASPGNIVAAVGPCIHRHSYEVDNAMRSQFANGDERFFAPGREGHWQFDLPAYVADRLRRCGVGSVDILPHNTYADEELFHSYRRATHRGGRTSGRQMSVIGLPAAG